MKIGTIKFHAPKGWGFIDALLDDFGDKVTSPGCIFFHDSAVKPSDLPDIETGVIVGYNVGQRRGKSIAVGVHVVPLPTANKNSQRDFGLVPQ
jgi:cold shock CspA family protein